MSVNFNNVSLRISAGLPKQFPADPTVQVAFSGRSNVGKSSLINLLLGRKSLARVSSAPGKTVTVNFYDVDGKIFFVDLPGYGFAKRNKEDQVRWSNLTEGYFTTNKNRDLVRLVVQLVDSRIGATEDDRLMIRYLAGTGIPFLIVATKSDKLNATERKNAEEAFRADPDLPDGTPILFSSVLKNEGRNEILRQISQFSGVRLL